MVARIAASTSDCYRTNCDGHHPHGSCPSGGNGLSGTLNHLRILEHIFEENRVVLPFPVNTNHSVESGGGVRRIKKHSPDGNGYRDDLPSWLVQHGGDRSLQAEPHQHSLHPSL